MSLQQYASSVNKKETRPDDVATVVNADQKILQQTEKLSALMSQLQKAGALCVPGHPNFCIDHSFIFTCKLISDHLPSTALGFMLAYCPKCELPSRRAELAEPSSRAAELFLPCRRSLSSVPPISFCRMLNRILTSSCLSTHCSLLSTHHHNMSVMNWNDLHSPSAFSMQNSLFDLLGRLAWVCRDLDRHQGVFVYASVLNCVYVCICALAFCVCSLFFFFHQNLFCPQQPAGHKNPPISTDGTVPSIPIQSATPLLANAQPNRPIGSASASPVSIIPPVSPELASLMTFPCDSDTSMRDSVGSVFCWSSHGLQAVILPHIPTAGHSSFPWFAFPFYHTLPSPMFVTGG